MQALNEVTMWIMERNPGLSEPPFLCLPEELSGTEIDMTAVAVDDFRSLAAIESRFFASEVAA